MIPEYEGSPLDLPQFTAKAGREDASYQDVEAWILAHIPQDSFGKYHGGGTSNQVECFNSCMSRQGDKNVNRVLLGTHTEESSMMWSTRRHAGTPGCEQPKPGSAVFVQ